MIIMKFGGGCLRNPESYTRVVEKVRGTESPVLVVSALFGLTDLLEQASQVALNSEEKITEVVEEMKRRHLALLEEIIETPVLKRMHFINFRRNSKRSNDYSMEYHIPVNSLTQFEY